jgi:hypothetical protein
MAILDLQALEPPVLEAKKKRRSRWSKHCSGGGGGGHSGLSLLLC